MFLKIFPLLFLGIITSGVLAKPLAVNHTAFDTIHEWNFLEYEYDSQSRMENIMNNSKYDKAENYPADFEVAEDGRIFVTMERNNKVPASLNTISTNQGETGPLLVPFPDWTWHSRNDCIGISAAYKIQIDDCNRLWVFDTGLYELDIRVCPAQLMMFDLSSNQLQLRINIPEEFYKDKDGNGNLVNMNVQSGGGWWCSSSDTYVYLTYFDGTGLVVWDGNKLWRLNGPDKTKLAGLITIDGLKLRIVSGTFSTALSPKIDDKPQLFFLRSAATENIFTVKVDDILATGSDLENVQVTDFLDVLRYVLTPQSEEPSDNKTVNYTLYEDVLPSTVAGMSFNSQGILFLGLTELSAIGCWNSTQILTADNVDTIDKDTLRLKWVQSAKVLQTSRTGNDEEELWILTTEFGEYVHGKMDFNKVNFRIMKQTTSRILTNSKCID